MGLLSLERKAPTTDIKQRAPSENLVHAVRVRLPEDTAQQISKVTRLAVKWFAESVSREGIGNVCYLGPSERSGEWKHRKGALT